MNALNASNFKFLSSVFARTLLAAFLLLPSAAAADSEDALISISQNASDVEIKFIGTLQSADALTGPWLDESGASPIKVSLSGASKYYRIKPFELPAAARFRVNLETGKVEVSPGSASSPQALRAAAVFAGSAIGFNSSVVLDEGGGNPGRKVLSVSLVNQSGESVGEDSNGVLGGIKVIFDEIKNLSAPSDLRLQSTVSTLAGTGVSGSTDGPALSATFVRPAGVAKGPDGSIYMADGTAHRVRKLYQHQVFTLAGSGSAASVDGIGTAASINVPWGIAYSAAQNALIVADRNGRRIRLLTLDGVVTTIAGTGAAGGGNGAGNIATFSDPIAVAVDGAGAIYVAEYPGQRIRKITLTGPDPKLASSYTVITWAGSGVGGSLDGVGTAAQFNRILGLVAEADGTLYVADASNFKIRRVSPAREVVTIAGTGIPGSTDGAGNVAKFNGPSGITLLNGSIAVTDYVDNTVRWLTLTPGGNKQNAADWQVRTLAGAGGAGATDGRGDVAQFNTPFFITDDGAGNLVVSDYLNAKLRKLTPTAGYFPVGIPAPTSVTEPVRLSKPDGIYAFTTAAAGATYRPFIGYDEELLPGATSSPRKWAFEVPAGVQGFEFNVTVMAPTDTKLPLAVVSNPGPTGVGSPDVLVSTLAGNGLGGHVNGPVTAARFNAAVGIAVDLDGNVYVADTSNHAIRRIGRNGLVSTIAGGTGSGSSDGRGDLAKFFSPRGVAAAPDGHTLYVADSSNNTIRRLIWTGGDPASPASWFVGTIVGVAGAAAYVDNTTGSLARFSFPIGIAWVPGDVVYVTESSGNRVRRLQPLGADLQLSSSWQVSLVAGSTTAPNGATGTTDSNGSSARFSSPSSVAVDQAGFLYVADSQNSRIRKIDPNGDVTTLAGSAFGYADGVGVLALFGQSSGLAVDSAGYVYVADTSNHRIRRVSPAGVVTTVAGTGDTFPGDIDGGGNVARFYFPQAVAVDAAGTLYVSTGGTYLFSGGGGVTSPGLRVRTIQRILK